MTSTGPELPHDWLFCPDLHLGRNILPGGEARHALKSRRMQPGDAVTLFNGAGDVGRGVILAPASGRPAGRKTPDVPGIAVDVDAVICFPPPAGVLHLVTAAAKGDRLDWAVEKCTELGATSIRLVNFARSVVRVGPAHLVRLSRTAIEACKQCHRAWLPGLSAHDTPRDMLDAIGPAHVLVADPDPANVTLARWLTHEPGVCRAGTTLGERNVAEGTSGSLAVVVGPEGGLTKEESEFLRRHGAVPVRLGQHILRVETAAVAAAATWAACHS